MKQITGIGIGKRLAIGRVYFFSRGSTEVEKQTIEHIEAELQRLHESLAIVRADLSRIAANLKIKDENSANIMLAHMEFLEDPGYIGEIEKLIQAERVNAEFAIESVCSNLVQEFMEIDDEYFRERASDIKDLSLKIIAILSGSTLKSLADIQEASIVVAEDLMPSDTAQLDPEKVLGFCTEKGTATSHTALLAKSFGIPAVIGCGKIELETGDTVIVDAEQGLVLVNPSSENIKEAQRKIQTYALKEKQLIEGAQAAAVTKDGMRCNILANIASASEAQKARNNGADGSGLLRTEFFFYQEEDLPSEDRQFEMYREVAEIMRGSQITIRTLDIGGDKPLKAIQEHFSPEQNPFLGLRGIRLQHAIPSVFNTQLRALFRVANEKLCDINIMFPFVTTVKEVLQLRETFNTCHAQLEADYDRSFVKPRMGVMIEIPSAALMINTIAKHVNFVSIGTNDLTQYTCAVDRTNESVAALASYCNPAVIKLVHLILQADTHVSICGEMAGDPLLIPLLYGMGLESYSMSAEQIPLAKRICKQLQKNACKTLVERCVSADTTEAVQNELSAFSKHHVQLH